MTYEVCDSSGRINLSLTQDQVDYMPRSGAADMFVAHLCHALADQTAMWDAADLRAALKAYGAWDEYELSDHRENVQRMVWILIGDVQESPELYACPEGA